MRRASSLLGIDSAIERELDSKYAVIKEIADTIASIEAIASGDLAALTAALNEAKDFTGITVVNGTPATWDAQNKVLTVPTVKGDTGLTGPIGLTGPAGAQGVGGAKGDTGLAGAAGADGLTPIVAITYDDITGNLEYEVTYIIDPSYIYTSEEW